FDMGRNSLSVIPADAFNGLTALDYLDISNNYAKIFGAFQDLPNLQIINLGYNDLTAVPAHFIKTGSSDLTYIYMWGNNITSVEPGAFDMVDSLYITMEDNSLSTLGEATWRPYLEEGGKIFADGNPLNCGCDIAWLFGEDQLLEGVSDTTTCNDGVHLHDLDPSIFYSC
ncbi:unnamed protein product, partial [Meganyctiphanes norvegica]